MAFHTQGAPTVIPSNQVGTGLIQGDQLGDQLPGILASLQESPEATKTSSLYYQDSVGKFTQPSFQRSVGALNLPIPINQFGDGGSVEINPDMYWKGPFLVSCTFNIPYAYYGPVVYRPRFNLFESTTATSTGTIYDDPSFSAGDSYFLQYAGSGNVRPRIFYSWGAAYANLREIRMNMGGAFSYVLDHYSNFVAVMASCTSMIQRAALMKAAGSGTMIPDYNAERQLGIAHDSCEIGMIPCYTADGGSTSTTASYLNSSAFGVGGQTGPSALPGPLIEHWLVAIKTPHTNFHSSQQYRRPIDTRLFSSNFVIDFFTSPNLDTFIDSGVGSPYFAGMYPSSSSWLPNTENLQYIIPASSQPGFWKARDGLFPSMLYRQLYIPNYSTLVASTPDKNDKFGMLNFDKTTSPGGAGGSSVYQYRQAQYTDMKSIALSAGYTNTYGSQASSGISTNYFNPANRSTFPTPLYSTIISASRLSNDQLGAKQILETRADLCVYYPFQHFTSQVYRVNQITTSTGVSPYSADGVFVPSTPFTNTITGGQGYGLLNVKNMKNFTASPYSYQNPLNVAISIPNNPLTVMYLMVMREKDRMALGYSTVGQYSPCLYWNALELQAFNLNYSAQILQKYNNLDEYFLLQLQERCEPLVVPFRGGVICRRDLPLDTPELIQETVSYPGSWYNSYIYELPMVDQLPLRNEAFFQQTPGFRGEMLSFNFWIKPSIRPFYSNDFDFRQSITPVAASTNTQGTLSYYNYVERIAAYCPGIPQSACNDNPGTTWNLNNDNLLVVCVFAQNALWQLNPLSCKVVFARGA